jgi:hypothetical protein
MIEPNVGFVKQAGAQLASKDPILSYQIRDRLILLAIQTSRSERPAPSGERTRRSRLESLSRSEGGGSDEFTQSLYERADELDCERAEREPHIESAMARAIGGESR